MNYISDILFWISTGLLIPVIVLLILLFVRSVILIGSFFAQYLLFTCTNRELDLCFKDFSPYDIAALPQRLSPKRSSAVVSYLHRMAEMAHSNAQRQKLISDFELEAEKDLSISKTLAKMGPMLGLMGTLIPMGPALVGLSSGDIASMAYNMQVAFATTVVGLFAAGIGYITHQIKKRWYTVQVAYLDFVAQLMEEKQS